jgi:tetratricopeptide (TPR) repeat protein
MATRTTLAATLHALGRWDAAAALFEEAERMQIRDEPAYPLLYSLRGFRYCDILLDQGRAADVLARAAHTLQWGKKHLFILDAALDHLSLGRVHLLADQRALSLPVESPALSQARTHLQQALDGLRRASMQEFLPLGLLARAAYFIHTRAFDDARRDLTDALALSTRCGFRLHECDAHLGFARLALAEGDRPAAAHHHEAARRLVEATSYHRRDSDLADLAAHLAA